MAPLSSITRDFAPIKGVAGLGQAIGSADINVAESDDDPSTAGKALLTAFVLTPPGIMYAYTVAGAAIAGSVMGCKDEQQSKPQCEDGRCLIKGGAFTMGSPEGVGDEDEHPARRVTISSFKIGQTKVSVGDYKKYLIQKYGGELRGATLRGCDTYSSDKMITLLIKADETSEQLRKRAEKVFVDRRCDKMEVKVEPLASELLWMHGFCKKKCQKKNSRGDDYPVVCLPIQDQREYCQAQGGDLMTTAQFEYAARFDQHDARAYRNNGDRSTAPVRSVYRNRFGVYDLLVDYDDVSESMRDAYDPNFYSRMPGTDPYNPLTDPQKQEQELRGGGFFTATRMDSRPADRSHTFTWIAPGGNWNHGFRCVWPYPDSEE